MSNSPAGSPEFVTDQKAGSSRDNLPPAQVLPMRIASDGMWYFRGSPILKPALVSLFARVLCREADGSYWLVTPAERGRIEVEDAPFLALTLAVQGAGAKQRLNFGINIDVEVVAGPSHPIRVAHDARTGEPRPYVLVRPGLEALIVRPVFYQMVDIAQARMREGREELGVLSDGEFFSLGALDGADAHG